MTSAEAPLSCPQCGRADGILRVADMPPGGPVRMAAPPEPRVRQSVFGCMSFGLITIASITAAILIGGLAEVMNITPAVASTGDLRPGDTGVFAGILAFMLVFVGLFSILVWRQVRSDRQLQESTATWQIATRRRAELRLCPSCGVVFTPGEGRPVPADQADLLLYQ